MVRKENCGVKKPLKNPEQTTYPEKPGAAFVPAPRFSPLQILYVTAWRRLLAGTSKPPGATSRFRKAFFHYEASPGNRGKNELGYAVSPFDFERPVSVVDEDDFDLTPIVAVNCARGV